MTSEHTLQLSDDLRNEIIAQMVQHHLYEAMRFFNNQWLEDHFEYFEHPAIDGLPSEELKSKAYKAIDAVCDLITPEYVKSIGDKS